CERDVQEACRLAPDEAEVILAVAQVARDKNNPGAARELLRKAVAAKRHAQNWRLVQALSRLEMLEGQPQAAVACLRGGLDRMPGKMALLWNSAHLLIQQRQAQEAAGVMTRMEKAGMSRRELVSLEARLQFHREEWLKAAQTLERVLPLFLRDSKQRN